MYIPISIPYCQVGVLKRKMPEATVGRKKMKEFLVRMIYVEMLGHDASFGYIKVCIVRDEAALISKGVSLGASLLDLFYYVPFNEHMWLR